MEHTLPPLRLDCTLINSSQIGGVLVKKKKKGHHLKGDVLQDLFIFVDTRFLKDYVALVALFLDAFGLKWLFGRKRLPTPALDLAF